MKYFSLTLLLIAVFGFNDQGHTTPLSSNTSIKWRPNQGGHSATPVLPNVPLQDLNSSVEGLKAKEYARTGDQKNAIIHYEMAYALANERNHKAHWAAALATLYSVSGDSKKTVFYAKIAMQSKDPKERGVAAYRAIAVVVRSRTMASYPDDLRYFHKEFEKDLQVAQPRIYLNSQKNSSDPKNVSQYFSAIDPRDSKE